jgi:hypothetical protein
MPVVHTKRTTCEYCLGIIEYNNKNLLKDRFDVVYIICPLCDSQVEVPVPDDMDILDIKIESEEDNNKLSDDLVDDEDTRWEEV